ncbi:hypothetical protein [Pullulanibacillus pueri]
MSIKAICFFNNKSTCRGGLICSLNKLR